MEKVIARARSGDQEALVDLIETLRPIRLSLIRQFPSLDGDDLDQDLVMVLMDCLRTYDPSMAGFAWYVRTQSRYHCLEKTKAPVHQSLDAETDEGMTLLETLEAGVDIETICQEKIRDMGLRQGLDQLDQKQYQVIFLYYFMDMGLAEIGHYLGCSVSSVSRYKLAGEKKLKKILRKDINYDY